MTFDEWWVTYWKSPGVQPALQCAFQEVAREAWIASESSVRDKGVSVKPSEGGSRTATVEIGNKSASHTGASHG